jgi:hypothetical protein
MPRYSHENFGDVQDHLFMKGIITSVDSENDLADVTVAGGSNGSDVPIFYHCEDDAEERSNGAIEGAAVGFAEDDEVIVMCTVDGSPVRIIGFVDGIKECELCLHEGFTKDFVTDGTWVGDHDSRWSGSGYDGSNIYISEETLTIQPDTSDIFHSNIYFSPSYPHCPDIFKSDTIPTISMNVSVATSVTPQHPLDTCSAFAVMSFETNQVTSLYLLLGFSGYRVTWFPDVPGMRKSFTVGDGKLVLDMADYLDPGEYLTSQNYFFRVGGTNGDSSASLSVDYVKISLREI